MKHSTVTVSSREVDYIGMVDGFAHLPELGLFAKKTHAGVELIVAGKSSATLVVISE